MVLIVTLTVAVTPHPYLHPQISSSHEALLYVTRTRLAAGCVAEQAVGAKTRSRQAVRQK
jgi:hypothetical protein